MTDRMAALTVLCDTDTPGRDQALQVGVTADSENIQHLACKARKQRHLC
jgi:hypothetical protein